MIEVPPAADYCCCCMGQQKDLCVRSAKSRLQDAMFTGANACACFVRRSVGLVELDGGIGVPGVEAAIFIPLRSLIPPISRSWSSFWRFGD